MRSVILALLACTLQAAKHDDAAAPPVCSRGSRPVDSSGPVCERQNCLLLKPCSHYSHRLKQNDTAGSACIACEAGKYLPSGAVRISPMPCMVLCAITHDCRTDGMLRLPGRHLRRREWLHGMLVVCAEIHNHRKGQYNCVCLRLCSWLYWHGHCWRSGHGIL